MKIAIIDKAPSKNNYSKYFSFEFELFHMSNVPISKLLKKDVDLDVELDFFDLVILVGSEAAKEYAKITSVTNYAGQLVNEKFVCISNPAVLIFKPEGKEDFYRTVQKISEYALGVKPKKVIGDFKGIDTEEEAEQFLREILEYSGEFVALDSETSSLYPRDGYVLGISLSYKPQHGRYILTDVLNDTCIKLLQEITDTREIVFHNMKFDVKMINYHLGIKFRPEHVHDTIIMHYILDENGVHGLKPLAIKYTDYGDYDSELEKFKSSYCNEHGLLQEEFTYDLIPFSIISKYASIDTAVTLELKDKWLPLIKSSPKFSKVYYDLLVPGTLFLNDMEEVGIPISYERMKAAEGYLDTNIVLAKEEIYKFPEIKAFEEANEKIFNPNSVKQLRSLLFDYLKLTPTGKLTATGAISTDAEVLEELSKEHPLPAAILKIRQLTKIKNTYVSKILPELDKDGCIRTNFNLIFTTSGRLSSSGKFNAQQIPRDDPIIKGCIVAPEGYSIVSQDLQTGEVYFAAVLSGDKALQKVFIDGGDFHSAIAKSVFDLPCDVSEVKKLYLAMRQAAKAISFGILYGSGAEKVSDTVSEATGTYYSIERAQDDIRAYFGKFKKLKAWLNSRKAFIEANGFTYSFFGRKRRLINVFSKDKGIAAHEVRSGINSEVQSLCSDVNLLAAIDTQKATRHLDAKIFMLVHDSIVAIVKKEHVEEFCEILKYHTQKDRGCSIPGCPIGVDQEIGSDYSFYYNKEDKEAGVTKFDKTYKLEGNMLSRI